MSITIVSFERALKVRSYSLYRSARIIIEYSNSTGKTSKTDKVALRELNSLATEFWSKENPTEKLLEEFSAKLLGVLKYSFESNNISFDTEELKRQLCHADHIYNWVFRDKKPIEASYTIVDNSENEHEDDVVYLFSIEHTELSYANKLVADEWRKIKSDKPPSWFEVLQPWQKNIFIDFYSIWEERKGIIANPPSLPQAYRKLPFNIKKRLIEEINKEQNTRIHHVADFCEFLGMQTGYIPYYPSVRNGYRVQTCLYKSSGQQERKLSLVRKFTFVRTALPVVHSQDRNEMLRLTIANIKQAILFDIIYPFRRISKYSNKTSCIVVPVLIQNIVSNHRVFDHELSKEIMYEAINELRKEFKSRDSAAIFFKNNFNQLKEIVERDTLIKDPKEFLDNIIKNKRFALRICVANHDAFKTTFWDLAKVPFSREKKEYEYLIETLDTELSKLISRSIFVGRLPLVKSAHYKGKLKSFLVNKDPLHAMEEIRKLELSDVTYKIPALKVGLDSYKMFLIIKDKPFTKAAYLLIAFAAVGLRIGGCANGCDFEGPLVLVVNALRIFYAKYGCFPEHPLVSNKEVGVYHSYVAKQFLNGYSQNIMDNNSQGSSGLTFLETTLGPEVKKKISFLCPEYGINSNYCDMYDNSLANSRLEVVSECVDLENIDEIVEEQYKKTKESEISKIFDDSGVSNEAGLLEIPLELTKKCDMRIKADAELDRKFKSDLSTMFNINSMEALAKELKHCSKSIPMGSSMSRILKFRTKYLNSLSENKHKDS